MSKLENSQPNKQTKGKTTPASRKTKPQQRPPVQYTVKHARTVTTSTPVPATAPAGQNKGQIPGVNTGQTVFNRNNMVLSAGVLSQENEFFARFIKNLRAKDVERLAARSGLGFWRDYIPLESHPTEYQHAGKLVTLVLPFDFDQANIYIRGFYSITERQLYGFVLDCVEVPNLVKFIQYENSTAWQSLKTTIETQLLHWASCYVVNPEYKV